MDFKVVFKDSFLEDLEPIISQIAKHNTSAALQLGERMVRTAESLSLFPERFPTVRQRPGIRRFIVGKYFKVYYLVRHENRTVEVLRCWDGRRRTEPGF